MLRERGGEMKENVEGDGRERRGIVINSHNTI